MDIDGTKINQRIDNFLKSCTESGEAIKLYQEMTLDRVKTRHISKYPVIVLNHEQVCMKIRRLKQKMKWSSRKLSVLN